MMLPSLLMAYLQEQAQKAPRTPQQCICHDFQQQSPKNPLIGIDFLVKYIHGFLYGSAEGQETP